MLLLFYEKIIIIDMLSALSWFINMASGSYSVSKAAEWSMTNGVRIELRSQGTLVVGVRAGCIDTNLTARLDVPKSRPEDVVARTIEAIAVGQAGYSHASKDCPLCRLRRCSDRL